MKKILVTTDFSNNSKAGIRFAMQLAVQGNYELIFYNVVEILKPVTWLDAMFKEFADNEVERFTKGLQKFIHQIHWKSNLPEVKYTCIAEVGLDVDKHIVAFAKKNKVDYICMSTRGAGKVAKLFGTNASELITTSPKPVIVVPQSYRLKPIKTLVYASDMENLDREMKHILAFNQSINNVPLDVFHYEFLPSLEANKKHLNKLAAKFENDKTKFHFKKLEVDNSLTFQMHRDIPASKASLLILFTKQNRNWFERLFLSSNTADISFNTKIPMLVFRK
jgi:nucleotide-binding universal stress UspA family protein